MATQTIPDVGATDAPEQVTVAAVMNTAPRSVSPFSSVTEASMIFRDEDCGMVPVVDEGKPVGVVTDRDVALSLATYPDLATRPVSEIMSSDVVSVTPETSLTEAARQMAERQIRRLVIVDDAGLLAGVLSWADLAPRLPDTMTGFMVSEVVEPA